LRYKIEMQLPLFRNNYEIFKYQLWKYQVRLHKRILNNVLVGIFVKYSEILVKLSEVWETCLSKIQV